MSLDIPRAGRRALFVLTLLAPCAVAQSAPAARYEFDITRGTLTMADGVRLAVTWWVPRGRTVGERFPTLLEYLPYRKDDSFYQRDYPLYSWFAAHGFLMAKVDVRGTGGSEGTLPPREYSAVELDDARRIIALIAKHPMSNGKVGMWGISWGGFNSLMLSMRPPPELKAIVALHASDDLYHDDVHYVDGIFHLDPYQLEIDHENGLPRTPDYPLDSAYFADRFDRAPWLFTYLEHPVDGPFWREESMRFSEHGPRIPAYLIGGLFDGYRDTPPRVLARATVPVKVEIGPWEHAWPDDGVPGPGYEWRRRAAAWWDHWLRGDSASALLREPRFMAFVRGGNAPDAQAMNLPGWWAFADWPPAPPKTLALFPAADGSLRRTTPAGSSSPLRYSPGSGVAGGDWWGDRTGDMGADDAGALVFDSPPLERAITIVGTPTLSLSASADASLAAWVGRLEDVSPTGEVALVTGGALNGAQASSRLSPARVPAGTAHPLDFELHFTTWTFRAGHRIRLAVSNAQFPMLWPTPAPMIATLHLGASTRVKLPLAPPLRPVPAGALPPAEPRDSAPDARTIDDGALTTHRVIVDQLTATTRVEYDERYGYAIGGRRFFVREFEAWETSDRDPAHATFLGVESHVIELATRTLLLESRMEVRGDSTWLRATFTRRITENGRLVRERTFADSARREVQ